MPFSIHPCGLPRGDHREEPRGPTPIPVFNSSAARPNLMPVTDTSVPACLERDGFPPVPVTGNCSLGRAVGNDVVLVDDRVSRRHATIHAQGEQEFWLVDLGSRNGTYLNGRRVSQPTPLHEGDRIQLGPFSLRFHRGTSRGAEAATEMLPGEQTQADLRSLECWLLLADIEGSTALAKERSPEDLAVLVGGWFARCKEAIEDHGGCINKYLGDGLFAYWPARQETLPHIAQALRDLSRLQQDRRPPFRLVLHLGRVLLGGIPSSGEESLAGPEVNFLFRLEKVVAGLGLPRCASEPAARALMPLATLHPAGSHLVPSRDDPSELFSF